MLYSLKCAKRADLILSVLTTKLIIKRAGGKFGGKGYVYGIDGCYGFTEVYLSPHSSSCIQ